MAQATVSEIIRKKAPPLRKTNKSTKIYSNTQETNQFTEDGVENETEELQPFDPEKISIDTKPLQLHYCMMKLEQGNIILSPDFQRNEVWTEGKKCALIESLMLKIPIPMFYVATDEKGVFSVVDGLQRLSAIRDFVLGKKYLETKEIKDKGEGFKLKELEFWGASYDNANFNSLPVFMQNRILETQFTFTIVNPGTPEEVKRNIFKRINTGGAPLTSQEIRHALYSGNSSGLLSILSEKEEFIIATSGTVKKNRMMDRELILRFLSFIIRDYTSYTKNDMDAFLSDTMRIINIMPDIKTIEDKKLFPNIESKNQIKIRNINQLQSSFITAMNRAYAIFGEHTFRRSFDNNTKAPINKSLFEVWSVLFSKMSDSDFLKLQENIEDFWVEYKKILTEPKFINSISRNSLKYNIGVEYRHKKLIDLLKKIHT